MFSNAQIIGIVVCILATIVVAVIVMRLDDAIIATHSIGEDDSAADGAPEPETAVSQQPSAYPAVGKNLSRKQRKGRSRS